MSWCFRNIGFPQITYAHDKSQPWRCNLATSQQVLLKLMILWPTFSFSVKILDYMFSEDNSIWDPVCSQVNHEMMNRPLSHYWIASSHNVTQGNRFVTKYLYNCNACKTRDNQLSKLILTDISHRGPVLFTKLNRSIRPGSPPRL